MHTQLKTSPKQAQTQAQTSVQTSNTNIKNLSHFDQISIKNHVFGRVWMVLRQLRQDAETPSSSIL